MQNLFMHLSDVHLDSPFYSINDSEKRKIRLNEQRLIFKNAMMDAFKNKVDFVLICGDFLDQNAATLETMHYVDAIFKEISPIPVVLIAGNHDSLFLLKYPFLANNVYCLNKEKSCVEFGKYRIYSLQADDDIQLDLHYYNILMWHGDFLSSQSLNPLPDKFKNIGFDYIALGHLHQFHDYSNPYSKIYYSGSLLARGFDEVEEKGYLLVKTSKETCVQFCPIQQRKYHKIEFDVRKIPYDDIFSLANEIKKQILNSEDCYSFLLKGKRNNIVPLNLTLLLDELSSSAFFIKIEDASVYENKPSASLFLKRFIEKMDKRIQHALDDEERNIAIRAKELGIAAIMNGVDENGHS